MTLLLLLLLCILLYAGMCEKNKLRVYGELKEVFECKKYLY